MDKNKSKSKGILLVPHLRNHIFRHTFTTRLNEQNIIQKQWNLYFRIYDSLRQFAINVWVLIES